VTNKILPLKSNRIKKNFEWLKNDRDFEFVYSKGRTIISEDKKLKARYLFIDKIENIKVKAGLSVISKKGNSVWRNRVKRILREALRKEVEKLLAIAKQKSLDLLIIFSPYSIDQNKFRKIYLEDINTSVLEILNRLEELAITQQK
jgi:ribonuclease P protein component